MEKLSMSESEAQEWRAAYFRKFYEDTERVYAFLRANNPKVIETEKSGEYSDRIRRAAAEMQISDVTATAFVIYLEVTRENSLNVLLKQRSLRREKAIEKDIQQLLGMTVPIPQDVWDALRLGHAKDN